MGLISRLQDAKINLRSLLVVVWAAALALGLALWLEVAC